MAKKDRIAIVLSILALFPGTVILDGSGLTTMGSFVVVGGILIVYWGFRFVQDGIGFLWKSKDD